MELIDRYISYVRNVRRYSERTVMVYSTALACYLDIVFKDESPDESSLIESLNTNELRTFMVELLDVRKMSPRTVNLHLSALGGFCRFLVKEGLLKSDPVRLLTRPKVDKRLPECFRKESLEDYFTRTADYAGEEALEMFLADPLSKTGKDLYERRLARMVISILYDTGLRRSELIGLKIESVDFGRSKLKVVGKGNKMREIPLLASLCGELLLYLKAVEALMGGIRSLKEPLLVTYTGHSLYPVFVDRTVKRELKGIKGMTGRRSPHVLRHSIATELMNEEADLNSIKEFLGHSSLSTTQVYTHSSFARLKHIYERAHPRAKNGGKHGD